MMMAAAEGHGDIVKVLLEAGADPVSEKEYVSAFYVDLIHLHKNILLS